MSTLLLLSRRIDSGGGPPSGDQRITAEGDDRITDDSSLRIVPIVALNVFHQTMSFLKNKIWKK